MRSHRGFTMIELLVVIAILGILLTVAVPSFMDSLARRRLEGVANELSTDLQYARTQAVSNNAAVSLVTSIHGYTVTGVVSAANVTYKTITLNSTISLTPSVTVTIDGYRSMPSAAVAITLTDSQTSAQLEIKADAMGRIQMCSPGASFGGYVAC